MILIKKTIFIIIISFFLTGCFPKKEAPNKVNTIIEKKSNIAIAINYPQFGFEKLDKQIKTFSDQTYQTFQNHYVSNLKDQEKLELNIDYSYQFLNQRYYNIVMTTFINSSNLTNPINEIQTFHYDRKTKKLLSLQDIISQDELDKIIPLIKNYLMKNYSQSIDLEKINSIINNDFNHYQKFTFTDDDFIFYFNPTEITNDNPDIIKVVLSLDKINLKIDLERGVFQEQKQSKVNATPKVIDPYKKAVAFTFDDGPCIYTKEIFKVLKKYNANATFFVIGNKVELYQDLLRQIVNDGNELGNHSYNHKWLTRMTDEELLTQITDTQNIIKKTTGFTPRLFRPTYGSINKHLKELVDLEIVMWTVDTSDWKTTNSKTIATKALKQIQDGDIILMHDNHKQSIQALDYLLKELKKQGYQFLTVSELNEISLIKHTRKFQR